MSNLEWVAKFQERLVVLRSRYGISKAEMARKSGLAPRTMENYFKGQKPSVEPLLAISRGEGVDLDWLLGEATEEKNFNTNLVGEAAWIVLNSTFAALIERAARGEEVVNGKMILGKDAGQLAAQIEAQIVAEYIGLRGYYTEPTLQEAKEVKSVRHLSSRIRRNVD